MLNERRVTFPVVYFCVVASFVPFLGDSSFTCFVGWGFSRAKCQRMSMGMWSSSCRPCCPVVQSMCEVSQCVDRQSVVLTAV